MMLTLWQLALAFLLADMLAFFLVALTLMALLFAWLRLDAWHAHRKRQAVQRQAAKVLDDYWQKGMEPRG